MYFMGAVDNDASAKRIPPKERKRLRFKRIRSLWNAGFTYRQIIDTEHCSNRDIVFATKGRAKAGRKALHKKT